MLETAIYISILKYLRPNFYFEFGTFLGINALNTAMNISEWNGRVITLDLDEESFHRAKLDEPDVPIAETHIENISRLAFVGTPHQESITCIYGDSNHIDLSKYYNKIDMVYVDGGHDLRTLQSDTENALKMLPTQGMSCIIWHDYLNRDYNITDYLDRMSSRLDLYHIEETMSVVYFKNASKELIAELG